MTNDNKESEPGVIERIKSADALPQLPYVGLVLIIIATYITAKVDGCISGDEASSIKTQTTEQSK